MYNVYKYGCIFLCRSFVFLKARRDIFMNIMCEATLNDACYFLQVWDMCTIAHIACRLLAAKWSKWCVYVCVFWGGGIIA